MGMYTGLRFKGIIKDKYREDIDTLIRNESDWSKCSSKELKEFSKVDRSFFIPGNTSIDVVDYWEDEEGNSTDGFDTSFNKESGLLCFQTELKNYGGTIDSFIETIVPTICEKLYHCEMMFEEWGMSVLYRLDNGVIKELDYGIIYEDLEKDNKGIPYRDLVSNPKKWGLMYNYYTQKKL